MDVSNWPVEAIEANGSDAKEWLRGPDDVRWLSKPAVVPANGIVQGEDWSEWAGSLLAELLGIPHAVVVLATRKGSPVALSRSLLQQSEELQAGAALLQGCSDFVPDSGDRLGHSLSNIQTVLDGVAPPRTWSEAAGIDAFGVFAGYLVFDALIANQDRHEDNWGVIRNVAGDVRLSESYDHATSLGFNVTDGKRDMYLKQDPTLAMWVRRGCASRFEHSKKVSLVDHAMRALERSTVQARRLWRESVGDLNVASFQSELERVVTEQGRLSAVAASFAVAVVTTNRRRILDEFGDA